jgi:hypothetical protein
MKILLNQTTRRRNALRTALMALAFAVTIGGVVAGPARADEDGDHRGHGERGHDGRDHWDRDGDREWRDHARVAEARRDDERRREEWRERHEYRPGVVYEPPAVIYTPVRPSPAIDFVFPIHIR